MTRSEYWTMLSAMRKATGVAEAITDNDKKAGLFFEIGQLLARDGQRKEARALLRKARDAANHQTFKSMVQSVISYIGE